jgi:hypothetical protein
LSTVAEARTAARTAAPENKKRLWKILFRTSAKQEKQHKGYRNVTSQNNLYCFENPVHSALIRVLVQFTQNGTHPLSRLYIDVRNVWRRNTEVQPIEFSLYDNLKKDLRAIPQPAPAAYQLLGWNDEDIAVASEKVLGEGPIYISHVPQNERGWCQPLCGP